MADFTSNLDLLTPGQGLKENRANNLFNAMNQAALFGRREPQSSGLVWAYYGGNIRHLTTGALIEVPNGQVTLTASATNYIYEENGTVSVVTAAPAGWPGPLVAPKRALYQVVCDATTATTWDDKRSFYQEPVTQIPKRIGTPAYSGTINCDWGLYDLIRITLTGNATLTFSGATDGQNCQLELTQDVTGSRIITWPATVRASTDLPMPALTTTANKMDKFGFQRNTGADKYDLSAVLKGF